MSRVRVDKGQAITGSWSDRFGGANRTYFKYEYTITDEVLPGNGWPLSIDKGWSDPGSEVSASGTSQSSTPTNQRVLSDFCPGAWADPKSANMNHLVIPGRPSNGALAAQLLAETNPSRSVVDLPIFLAELREIPDLIKSAGDSIIRKIASGNLKYQFALKPLISDLRALLDFQKHFSDREKELTALNSSGLRRTRQLWSSSISLNDSLTANSSPSWCLLKYDRTRVTTSKVWGHVKWFPQSQGIPKSRDDIAKDARRAVLGLTLDPVTAWELIPWSWLVDWCSSVGNYLQSQRNIVGAIPSTPLIMETKRTTTRFTCTSDPTGLFVGKVEPLFYRESKTRQSASASISASLPVLTLRQLSILGSISVLRSTKR